MILRVLNLATRTICLEKLIKTAVRLIMGVFFFVLVCPPCCWAQTYSPGIDTNLVTWFKADALSLTNNSQVSIWNPSGGSMTNAVGQNSVTNQPTFQTAQQNGLPAVLFDGVSSYLTNSTTYTPATSQPFTAFLVYKYNGPNGVWANAFVGGSFAGGNGSWFLGVGTGAISFDLFETSISCYQADPNWHIAMFVVNGTNSKYRLDRGIDTPGTGNPGTGFINSLEMGGTGGSAQLWTLANAYLGELLIYNGDQSANENAIFNYLDGRWAILESEANPPFTLNWPDRRPIGMDVLGNISFVTTNNPRGWFNSSGVTITTSNGLAAFQSQLLARASNEVSILTNMNAQGVIFWDMEGYEESALAYVGDPRMVPFLAPEVDSVADQFFSIYTRAGLRVGMTLRPQTFGAGATLPTGNVGDVFVLTNAPFAQKAYYYNTKGWIQGNIGAPVTWASYADLSNKVSYARTRWGCTMFYIDSYGTLDQFGPGSVATLTNILQAYPGTLLAPECAFAITLYNNVTKMFAFATPYLQPNYTGYSVPTNVLSVYPQAAALVCVNGDTDVASMKAGIQAGNIMLVNSWFPNSTMSAIQQARLGAAPQPPTDLHIMTNAP